MTQEELNSKIMKEYGIDLTLSNVKNDWKLQKFLFLAPSKWGKTVFWAQEPSHFFFKFEQRHNHVKHVGVDCRSWNEFEKVLGKLEIMAEKGVFPFEVVVLDPVDRLIQLIDDEVIDWAKEKYTKFDSYSIGDVPEGNGWARRTTMINSTLSKLESLPCAKALLFHTFTEEKADRSNQKKKKQTIDVGGKAGSKLLGWADHILHGQLITVGTQDVRRIYTEGSETLEAGVSNPLIPKPFLQQKNDKGDYEAIKENYFALKGYFTNGNNPTTN